MSLFSEQINELHLLVIIDLPFRIEPINYLISSGFKTHTIHFLLNAGLLVILTILSWGMDLSLASLAKTLQL